MRVIYGIKNLKGYIRRSVVTIGIFDGLHLGHQFIIKKIIKRAKQIGGRSVVLTFDPHPKNIIKPKSSLPLLISIEHRIKLLRNSGIDICIVVRFSRRFSNLNPEKFIKKFFVKRIHSREVFVGSGFKFGKETSGDIELLKMMGRLYDFKVKEILPVKIGKDIVSSSSIRRLIQKGDLKKASQFLGRGVSVFGKVIKGKAEGRILGYPTANVNPCGEVIPPSGVYAARVNFGKKILTAMAYIGSKPTYNKKIKNSYPNIEVYIFNFNKKIYGKYIEIEFLKKIRDERKFLSQDKLKKQIEKDERAVKSFLKTHHKK